MNELVDELENVAGHEFLFFDLININFEDEIMNSMYSIKNFSSNYFNTTVTVNSDEY